MDYNKNDELSYTREKMPSQYSIHHVSEVLLLNTHFLSNKSWTLKFKKNEIIEV